MWGSTDERGSFVNGGKVVAAGSSQWHAVMLHRMDSRVDSLVATGAKLILVLEPAGVQKNSMLDSDDIAYERMNALLRQVAARHPNQVGVVNLAPGSAPPDPPVPTSFLDSTRRFRRAGTSSRVGISPLPSHALRHYGPTVCTTSAREHSGSPSGWCPALQRRRKCSSHATKPAVLFPLAPSPRRVTGLVVRDAPKGQEITTWHTAAACSTSPGLVEVFGPRPSMNARRKRWARALGAGAPGVLVAQRLSPLVAQPLVAQPLVTAPCRLSHSACRGQRRPGQDSNLRETD